MRGGSGVKNVISYMLCMVMAAGFTACGYDLGYSMAEMSLESEHTSETSHALSPTEYETVTDASTEPETFPETTAVAEPDEPSPPMPQEIDMSQYSEHVVLLTGQDMLIRTGGDYNDESPITWWLVFSEEQLEALPQSYREQVDASVLEQYPLGDYVYAMVQKNFGSGGYHYRAGGLLIDGEKMFFVNTQDSYAPKPDEPVPTVMTGVCYFAAVPSEYIHADTQYTGWTVPDTGDYTQSPLYFTGCGYVDDAELLEKLPLQMYAVESDADFDRLAAAADTVELASILRGHGHAPSLDDSTLFVSIFDRESTEYADDINTSMYPDGKVCLTFHITASSHKTEGIGIAYAYIPKAFLNENSLDGWAKLTS